MADPTTPKWAERNGSWHLVDDSGRILATVTEIGGYRDRTYAYRMEQFIDLESAKRAAERNHG